MDFTASEKLVLEKIQKGVPCSPEPYGEIAKSAGLHEDEVIQTVISLREKKVIRNISAIFDGKVLGYSMSLIAFQVKPENIEHAAEIINSHPGVSHNYLRHHKYNIWFTLAEESPEDFTRSAETLACKCHAEDFLVMRNERLLKIGVFLDTGNSGGSYDSSDYIPGESKGIVLLSAEEIEAVRLLQRDLPAVKRPFAEILKTAGSSMTEESLLKHSRSFLERGIMRRYAAVLRHRNAGYTVNSMTAWRPEADYNMEPFSESRFVSHLYFRTVYPGRWEYPLFAMIHARSEDELDSIIQELSAKSGIKDFISLLSLREFKKKRVTYFSESFKEWKRLNYD
ncbi:MAG TPA: Lrp/AsnC family transcriptional regulator [Spirochaetota bacterium]|nr:Lrp/AsnC family transcriptional regulator [Spirochaetota bacterium]